MIFLDRKGKDRDSSTQPLLLEAEPTGIPRALAKTKETAKKTKQNSRLNNQNNNSVRALHFLVHFFTVTARLGREIS